ncbi:hypothetical protein KUV64_13505 [Mameliella alba]|uniref:hypothetical protein n=1 Tax=Mameliella alba TaxID=561184 RepID=UPI000B5314F5|nr:hypothetical protein [Mameliella alba]MBY6120149.1 hypothetical protein [Mameliella alba]OWV64344.1 hypothetical protein CDZ97_10720 [Mameliella alba]
MLLTALMMSKHLRHDPPRATSRDMARDMARPRPTVAAALLLAGALSLPFAALAVVEAVF